MSNIKTNKSTKFGVSNVLEEQSLYQGSWSNLVEISYEDEKREKRKWEVLHRKNDAEAVIIIAKMEPSDRYIIIRQFRPPTNSYLLEFPAGLVDSGETPEQTADLDRISELEKRHECVHIEANPGDALFFHANLLHSSDSNKSNELRRTLIVCFNTKSNNPYKEKGHASYTPLKISSYNSIMEY